MSSAWLAAPVTTKMTESLINTELYIVSSSMQGWRASMEDFTVKFIEAPNDAECVYTAIFDGHGGTSVARYASMHLHDLIMTSTPYMIGDIRAGIREGYLTIDEIMKDDPWEFGHCGSTAVTVLIKGENVFCGNAGDSMAVACIGKSARTLSTLHKPSKRREYQRIVRAGFTVRSDRVGGRLGMSRSLGDFRYKNNERLSAEEQAVTANPDIMVLKIRKKLKFIFLASDGVWEKMTERELVSFILERIRQGVPPETIVEDIFNKCLAPAGVGGSRGFDNMSGVLILFKNHLKESYWETVAIHDESNKSG